MTNRWVKIWPEMLVAILASVAFFGSLGALDLWSQAEQRATADAVDTLDHHHWLVAHRDGRPRFEEPPLSRWVIAALMAVTHERSERILRIPGSLCGLAIVCLVYLLGRRFGGRAVGLASAFVLCSIPLFVGELRQAGAHGIVALLLTLTIHAAWQRLYTLSPVDASMVKHPRGTVYLFYASIGFGVLAGGLGFLFLTGLIILATLATSRQTSFGLGRLWDSKGCGLLMLIGASWPLAILVSDRGLFSQWLLAITAELTTVRFSSWPEFTRALGAWPGWLLPWTPIALLAVLVPFLPDRVQAKTHNDTSAANAPLSPYWLAWWWSIGSVVAWAVSPSSPSAALVVSLPGMAILTGDMWVRLAQAARHRAAGMLTARLSLQVQWVLLFFMAAVLPLFSRAWLPADLWPWSLAVSASVAAATIISVVTWRRGADALALAPITTALVASLWVAYAISGPSQNPLRSHRALANTIHRLLPPDVQKVAILDQVEPGIHFYANNLDLEPLTIEHSSPAAADRLIQWLDHGHPGSSFILLRESLYGQLAARLGGRVTPILREAGLSRDELVLLRVEDAPTTRTAIISSEPVRR
jgi:4-amino-4-deoxy-L-arabinose transferase-like glycosyltransferase